MIGKVMRGQKVHGLLAYLFGPGRANEHVDPHLVASWDDAPAALDPPVLAGGRRDVRQLAGLLDQPLAATVRAARQPVWHCAIRVAPSDRRLSDAEWRDVARDVMARTGLAPVGDDGGCRWVAVRHADDHIHLVVTLARQDGAAARTSNDFYRVGEACRAAEERLGLIRTAPRDRTAASRPTRAEAEKAARAGRREPARVTLQREVRTASAAAETADEFLTRLSEAGLLVRPRYSVNDPGVVTGYAVALPGDHARAGADTTGGRVAGASVWFGGASLAPDLSWPSLATRWRDTATPSTSRPLSGQGAEHWAGRAAGRLAGQDRADAWQAAVDGANQAADAIRQAVTRDPASGSVSGLVSGSDAAHATARLLAATARTVEGRAGGPLTDAADAFDRAARDLYGRMPARSPVGSSLRAAARLVALTGRASRDETTQVLALIAALVDLTGAVADLRDAQGRAAQAAAARAATDHLDRAGTPHPPSQPGRVAAAVIHTPRVDAAVHRKPTRPAHTAVPRRRVQP